MTTRQLWGSRPLDFFFVCFFFKLMAKEFILMKYKVNASWYKYLGNCLGVKKGKETIGQPLHVALYMWGRFICTIYSWIIQTKKNQQKNGLPLWRGQHQSSLNNVNGFPEVKLDLLFSLTLQKGAFKLQKVLFGLRLLTTTYKKKKKASVHYF